MKRLLLSFVLMVVFSASGLSTPAQAWPWDTKPGASCKKIGDSTTISNRTYSCRKNQNLKSVWLPNPPVTKAAEALALAYAGCFDNRLSAIQFYPITWYGVALDYGLKINWFQSPEIVRRSTTFDIDVALSNYISQTFTLAATLDSHYTKVLSVWNQSIQSVKSSMNQRAGDLSTVLADSTRSFSPTLQSMCTLVQSQLQEKAKLEVRTESEWEKRNAGKLLPKSPFPFLNK